MRLDLVNWEAAAVGALGAIYHVSDHPSETSFIITQSLELIETVQEERHE